MNLSQADLAEKAGLARRTITAIEHGEGSSLATLIALLRGLHALGELENLLPDPGPSPIALTRVQEKPRKYASKPRKPKSEGPWKWGDEK